ncbi:MAG: hypothetical protein Ct9H90mP18_03850 [Gammaproteobacteria bacterium]|nr:MAG: hypothetical protein Ct9H90mP18_03850 [Gammaproteobacteria bacterium]
MSAALDNGIKIEQHGVILCLTTCHVYVVEGIDSLPNLLKMKMTI